MNRHDELHEIWNSQPSPSKATGEDIVALVQERIQSFDRAIKVRNLRECVAGGVVFVVFVWFALRMDDALSRAGSLIVAASAAWIIYYLVRSGKSPGHVDPSQNLMSYARSLVENYDHQIRLLRSAKYWYLLPMYVGLLTMSAGLWLHGAKAGSLNWRGLAYPAFYTVVFASIWWLNEGVAVRRLQRSRSRILAMTAQDELQDEIKDGSGEADAN